MSGQPVPPLAADAANRSRHWQRNRRLTAALLAVWFVVSFGVAFFARDLGFQFFGWPFAYWMAAQGALVVYLVLVGVYARQLRRLDEEHGLQEED